MSDDIVTRLREMATESLFGVGMAPFEYHNAADEIERLRATLKKAEAVLLEGGNLMTETVADRDWWRDRAVDYAYDDETCECDRCTAVRAAWEETQHGR